MNTAWRSCRWRRAAQRLLCLLLLTAACIGSWAFWISPDWRLYINVSPSLPDRLYLVRLGTQAPRRGQLMAFYPPPLPEYPPGALFLKYVVAVPGDLVHIDADTRHWWVNGRDLGLVRRQTHGGRILHPGPIGLLPPQHYAVWTQSPDSYDSRYADVGWIPQQHILGLARPVL